VESAVSVEIDGTNPLLVFMKVVIFTISVVIVLFAELR
jgi:hypothetical protein